MIFEPTNLRIEIEKIKKILQTNYLFSDYIEYKLFDVLYNLYKEDKNNFFNIPNEVF